ncbi:MAG: hypothetical protein KatS3mg068_0088 [Candidatus Sericytochromatia bacterium]|nr:MAG: hypothetical protein KatS3mg068_0088 [Candidatus Sericytochromatia bacterium]
MRKLISTLLLVITTSCAVPNDLNNPSQKFLEPPALVQTQNNSKQDATLPKLKLKINQADIDVTEDDLNAQLKAILDLSNEKRIKDTKMTIKPGNKIEANGIIEQKVPLTSDKTIKVPFWIEGNLSVLPKNTIKFEVSKVKIASIPVKTLMDVLGLELSNFTKFKDKYGRIELLGNNFLLIIDKFTDDAIIDGQIKKVETREKFLKVIF